MPDNDNSPLSDSEQRLISFIQSVRPESAALLKLRYATEKWLWHGKLCAIICAAVVFGAALLSGWHGLPALLAIIGASTPLVMILSLERLLGRWKGRLCIEQGRPTSHWHFERAAA
ncbi:hypothetical protein TomTYG75_05160 [Sphingobium sp. TomTYG75]